MMILILGAKLIQWDSGLIIQGCPDFRDSDLIIQGILIVWCPCILRGSMAQPMGISVPINKQQLIKYAYSTIVMLQ